MFGKVRSVKEQTMRVKVVSVISGLLSCAAAVHADLASIPSMKDNTLYSSSLDNPLSNGSGEGMFAGRNGNGGTRRALVKFDIAGNIPAGSTITAVTLQLTCTQTVASSQSVSLHRCLADWGEGVSYAGGGGGGGDVADVGDCTWQYRRWATQLWTTPGGDFVATASGSRSVGSENTYVWPSTAGLVSDVQGWLDNPSGNHGWLIRGGESGSSTAKRFGTREEGDALSRPKLVVTFTPPVTCDSIDFNNDGLFPDTQDIEDFLLVFAGGACSNDPNCGDIDFNNDGLTPDTLDVESLLSVFAGGACL
jgi:hypothetical protein